LLITVFIRCDDTEKNIRITVAAAAEEYTDQDTLKQEGKLRASAIVIEGKKTKLCIVSCDIIVIERDYIDEINHAITSLLLPQYFYWHQVL